MRSHPTHAALSQALDEYEAALFAGSFTSVEARIRADCIRAKVTEAQRVGLLPLSLMQDLLTRLELIHRYR
jgi:hypothetical protein